MKIYIYLNLNKIKNNKTCRKGLIEMYYSNIPIILLLLSKIWSNNNINILKSYNFSVCENYIILYYRAKLNIYIWYIYINIYRIR